LFLAGSCQICPPPKPIDKSDIEVILLRIDCSGSGYIYMYDNYTIQNEINFFDSLLTVKTLSPLMKELITVHLARTRVVSDSFKYSKNTPLKFEASPDLRKITVYAKPPNPCPKPGGTMCMYSSNSISYFSKDSTDAIQVTADGQTVEQQATYYDALTNIKTVEFSKAITANNTIQLTLLDAQGITVATYTENVQNR
jgi:hypothetical protein